MARSHRRPFSGKMARPGSLDAPCSLSASQSLRLSGSFTASIRQFVLANVYQVSLCTGPCGRLWGTERPGSDPGGVPCFLGVNPQSQRANGASGELTIGAPFCSPQAPSLLSYWGEAAFEDTLAAGRFFPSGTNGFLACSVSAQQHDIMQVCTHVLTWVPPNESKSTLLTESLGKTRREALAGLLEEKVRVLREVGHCHPRSCPGCTWNSSPRSSHLQIASY